VNLSALVAFPDSSPRLFPASLRGANGGGPSEIYSQREEEGEEKTTFAGRNILGTKYGREERAIPRSATIFPTGLAKRSGPANGRSGYWFSMADGERAKGTDARIAYGL